MRIITFNGQMGVGKSTAIEDLKFYAGEENVKLVKFAGPLYDMQEFMYRRISPVYQRPETFIKDRKLLQWIGTEWGRDSISSTLWVDLWKAEANRLKLSEPKISIDGSESKLILVCDDVRFDNEAEVVRSMDGIVVKITADRVDNRIDTKAGIAAHKSESGIDSKFISYTIENNGTVFEFQKKLRELFKQLGLVSQKAA